MALQPSIGAEIIPGYRLLDRLGTGGYGDVWKAEAPGGLCKAVKIVYGQIGDARAEQELRALSRIREVRHPFLLSLERFEIIDGQLLIVTELADMSLMDRYEQCRKTGLRGIPRDELLLHLHDAADALDYMNEHYDLQHLDIKPENLLLVGGRLKIADFGLVKDFSGTSATVTGGVTPVYATPEAFDGKVSRYSDQYSLAIVYQEMLTGVRPFPGTTAYQLAMQHSSSPPMLESLPPADRPIIARALAKKPEQRFPNCREMVAGLRPTSKDQTGPAPAVVEPGPAAEINLSPLPSEVLSEDPNQAGCPVGMSGEEAERLDTEVGQQHQDVLFRLPQDVAANRFAAPAHTPHAGGKSRLRPTLFLGVGGIARWTLQRLRARLQARFDDLSRVPIFRMLLLDSDRTSMQLAQQPGDGGEALAADETLLLPLHRPEHYRSKSKELLRWLERRWLYSIPGSLRTEGIRPLGRLAFVDNASILLPRLRETIELLASQSAKQTTHSRTGMRVRSGPPQIFFVASVSGGTGGGMVLDLAYAVRQILTELQLSDSLTCAFLVHATSPKPASQDLARINAYATLSELRHFSRANVLYPGDRSHGLKPSEAETVPFQECYLVHLGEQLAEAEADLATDSLAEYLYVNSAGSADEFFRQFRQKTYVVPPCAEGEPLMRTFGLARICFPREQLASRAADLLCRKLVAGWRNGLFPAGEDCLKKETSEMRLGLGLEAQALEARFHTAIPEFLGQEPDALVSQILEQTLQSGAQAQELAVQSLAKIDGVLGISRVEEGPGSPSALLKVAMDKQARSLAAKMAQDVVKWLIASVEHPQRRLKVADRASRFLVEDLSSEVENAQTQLLQFRTRRDTVCRAVIAAAQTPNSGLRWLSGTQPSGSNTAPVNKLVDYCCLRLKEMSLEKTIEVLRTVCHEIAHFAQGVADCQQRLGTLAERFKADLTSNSKKGGDIFNAEHQSSSEKDQRQPTPNSIELLPEGARSLEEAAQQSVASLEPQFVLRFDEQFQKEVLNREGGLWGLSSARHDLLTALPGELHSRARAALLDKFMHIDAAKLFVKMHDDPARLKQSLLKHIRAAAPRLAATHFERHLVLGVPGGPELAEQNPALKEALEGVPAVYVNSDCDLIVCQESAPFPIGEAADALIDNQAIYADNAKRAMTRRDVHWFSVTRATLESKTLFLAK